MIVTGEQLADAAESLEGTRYTRYGRSRERVDCLGVVLVPCVELGLQVPDPRNYDAGFPDPDFLVSTLERYAHQVDNWDQGPGRVGICRADNQRSRRPFHFVVMLRDDRVIHASARDRKVVIAPRSWLDGRLMGVYRVNGIEYGEPWHN